MATSRLRPSRQVIVFTIVGVINTATDLLTYLFLLRLTNSIVLSNIVATSVGLGVSYVLHNRFTFKQEAMTLRRLMLFLAVTLTGLWVVQTIVIYALTPLVARLPQALFSWLGPLAVTAKQLLPKLLATGVSLVWNYIWYSRVVFAANRPKH